MQLSHTKQIIRNTEVMFFSERNRATGVGRFRTLGVGRGGGKGEVTELPETDISPPPTSPKILRSHFLQSGRINSAFHQLLCPPSRWFKNQ